MYKYSVSLLIIWFRVCLAHSDADDGMDLFKIGSSIYGSNKGDLLLSHGGALINGVCPPDKSRTCGTVPNKNYPKLQGSTCIRQGCCWDDESRRCYQRVHYVLKPSPTIDVKQQWCEDNGNLYYNNICYFITDEKSTSTTEATGYCKNTHSDAVLVEVTSASVQENLSNFVRRRISSNDYYRTGGRYDVGSGTVSWNNKEATTTNFNWKSGYPSSTSSWTTLYLTVFGEGSPSNGMFNNHDNYNFRAVCQIQWLQQQQQQQQQLFITQLFIAVTKLFVVVPKRLFIFNSIH